MEQVDTSLEHVKQLEDELLKLRIENAFLKERSKNERFARIINSFRGQFKQKDLLSYAKMPKATYRYWQERFDRDNPNKELEKKIIEIHLLHKDYGYRRMFGELHKQRYFINKKRVQRIMQKLSLQVTYFTRKSRKYSSYNGSIQIKAGVIK